MSAGWGIEVQEIPLRDGVTDADALREALGEDVSAVFLAQPNFLGAVEDLEALVPRVKESGAIAVCSCDPMTLGVLRPPGDFGVDIAVGEGQPLGNRLDYGGPSFGFFAAQQAFLRRIPGRIAGETTDVDGRRGFVLTLQTREQHIRRERATSNITTAQTLNALAAIVYLSWLGRRGIVEIGELMLQRTAYARSTLAALEGVEALHEQPVVREFAVRLDADVADVIERCAAEGVNPGYPLGADYPEYEDGLLVAITEQRTREDIDRLASVLGARGGRRAPRPPARGGDGMTAPPRRPCSATARRRSSRSPTRAGARSCRPRSTCRRTRTRCPSASAAASRRGCRRSPSRRSTGTSTGSPSATSTSTPASIRSARAR